MNWNLRKLAVYGLVAALAALALVFVWRLDPVQRMFFPERFWSGKIQLLELQIDRLRDRAVQCASSVSRLQESAAAKNAGSAPGAAAQDLGRLCQSYSEEIKRAVDDVIAAREALRKSRG